jgi:hypothetical protein
VNHFPLLQEEVVKAEPTTMIVMAIAGIAMMVLSRLLYKPPKGDRGKKDEIPTTLATRGEWMNYIFGTRKTGYNFGFAWNRIVRNQGGGGGGKGGGGGGGGSNYVWYEDAWHLVAVGPVASLESILINGESVWDTRLTRETTPSGTTFQLPNRVASFKIYWGERNQPLNDDLGSAMGIWSTWPYCFYIHWIAMNLGSAPRWPQVEYVYTHIPTQSPIPGQSYIGVAPDGGINPAFILAQILMSNFPHGLGISSDFIEGPYSKFVKLFRDEGLAMNLMVEPGSEAERVLQAIAQDAGLFFPYQGRKVRLLPQRLDSTDPIIELNDDVIIPPDLQRTVVRGEKELNRLVFVFKSNRNWDFRDFDVAIAEDGETSAAGSVSATRLDMPTVTDAEVADSVANRRFQENQVEAAVKLKVMGAGRKLIPGQVFIRDGQRYRVTTIRWKDDSPGGEIEAVIDSFGISPTDVVRQDPTPVSPTRPAQNDVSFTWLRHHSTLDAMVVFRIRDHRQTMGAFVYAKSGDGGFILIGSQNVSAVGGPIENTVSDVGDEIIEEGPVFEDISGDASELPDLSDDEASWLAGDLIAVIDDEVFFIQSISAQEELEWLSDTEYALGDSLIPTVPNGFRYVCIESGTTGANEPTWPRTRGSTVFSGDSVWEARHYTYRPNNMVRARLGSLQTSHSLGSYIYIIPYSSLSVLRHPMIQSGATICVKTVPFTESKVSDIATVTEVCRLLAPDDSEGVHRVTSDGEFRITNLGDRRITEEEA